MDPFNDEYFMKQALVEARSAAEEGEVPVGAVIVCNNQIIARAHNQTERLNDNRPCRDVSDNGGSRRLRSQVSDRMQPLRDGGTMRDVCRSNRMVATKQDRLRATDEKRGFQQYAPKALHPKATVKKGFLKTNAPKKCANSFSASAEQLISLPHNPHTPLIFCKNLFSGDLRSIFFSCRAVTARVGRVTACLTALFTLLSTTSASEQDIFKGTQDRESH